MTEYQEQRTHIPPVLAIENGELVIKIIFGEQTFVAGVSDGRWFFSQVVAKLVDPALAAAYPRADFQRKDISALDAIETARLLSQAKVVSGVDANGVPFTHYDLASPND